MDRGARRALLVLKKKVFVSLRALSYKRPTARFFAVPFRVLSRKNLSGDLRQLTEFILFFTTIAANLATWLANLPW